jgi:hypothetical protein
MPDFASSVESLQLQRGVGTSTNGAGAFGASLNLLTDSFSNEASGEISNAAGSFTTRKHTVKFSSGLLNDNAEKNSARGFELAGRLSNIDSQGYIDRASSDLKSYFLQGTFVGKTTLIKALVLKFLTALRIQKIIGVTRFFWGEKRIDLAFWHQRCHMLIESETRKTKAPEVRHVIGSNPFRFPANPFTFPVTPRHRDLDLPPGSRKNLNFSR